MMAHPLALQLRNLQSMVEIGVDKNSTVVFPAPLMSTITELGNFLAREAAAAAPPAPAQPGTAAGPATTTQLTSTAQAGSHTEPGGADHVPAAANGAPR
jgi:hypothetical protein